MAGPASPHAQGQSAESWSAWSKWELDKEMNQWKRYRYRARDGYEIEWNQPEQQNSEPEHDSATPHAQGKSADEPLVWSNWEWDVKKCVWKRYQFESGLYQFEVHEPRQLSNQSSRSMLPPTYEQIRAFSTNAPSPRQSSSEAPRLTSNTSIPSRDGLPGSVTQQFQSLDLYGVADEDNIEGPGQDDPQQVAVDVNTRSLPKSFQNYQQVNKPSGFFRIGRVFKTPWSEPAGNAPQDQGQGLAGFHFLDAFGTSVYSKVRHFVVIREKQGACLCLALFTHNGQGATKPRIRTDDYAAVYPIGGQPEVSQVERLTKQPFGIIVEGYGEVIHPMSRLNFSRIYTVEHNLRIINVGRIANEDLARLNNYFVSSNDMNLSSNTSVTVNTSGPQNSVSNKDRVIYPPIPSSGLLMSQKPSSSRRLSEHDTRYSSYTVPVQENTPPQAPSPSLGGRATKQSVPPLIEVVSRMKVVSAKLQMKFWTVGRVFMCLWTEPAGINSLPAETSSASHFSPTYLNGTAYTEIRRFVVVGEGYGNSICSPIYTYGGQATLKPNLPDTQQHAIIHTSKLPPPEKSYYADDGTLVKENLVKEPTRVISEQGGDEGDLGDLARVNFSKIYTVEHYVRVLNIGKVHPNSMAALEQNSMFNRPASERPQPPRGKVSNSHTKGSRRVRGTVEPGTVNIKGPSKSSSLDQATTST